ncbi:PREDICTED: uncharacterized protein LOC105563006 [Vollenhovia emeryi]|uniref:uncharacterized protein LOC105563006 n=1 Tax=Vollenhovia emeryi TaxID=411798 RepID=UPI0005F47DD0|nr:PREDICTED: uncharacterized protein LOC105563006 [Vollenhovia emeryi]XP_011869635.1 PREDICTED: uncharacterized protein LOC105563006 [Vollenhovia emeryi]
MASTNKEVKKKRVFMSVVQKLELIKKLEEGVPVTDICQIYDISKRHVREIRKLKPKLLEFLSTNYIGSSELYCSILRNKKIMNLGRNINLDKALYEWYIEQTSSGIVVQYLQLKSMCGAMKERMGLSIKNIEIWLQNFRKRHGISLSLTKEICSESSDSKKKNINQDQVMTKKFFKVGNLPSSSASPPIASTTRNEKWLRGRNKCLDKALYKWYIEQRSKGVKVQNFQLQFQYEALKKRLRRRFKDATWLTKFKKRHGLVLSVCDKICRTSSNSKEKNINQDQVMPVEFINVENLPPLSPLPPIASTHHISEGSVTCEGVPLPLFQPPIASTCHNVSKLNASTKREKEYTIRGPNKYLDKALHVWYDRQRSSGIDVQELHLKSEFNALVNRIPCKVNNADTWLRYFKERHGLVSYLGDKLCRKSSDSEKKTIHEDQVMPVEFINVENLPSPSTSLPIASTHYDILEESIKGEGFPSPLFPPPIASTCHNISKEPIKVENLPSPSSSPPITSTPFKILEECIKVENVSSTDVYHNYVWEEYNIKSEGDSP